MGEILGLGVTHSPSLMGLEMGFDVAYAYRPRHH
jgi:hypothetical protein